MKAIVAADIFHKTNAQKGPFVVPYFDWGRQYDVFYRLAVEIIGNAYNHTNFYDLGNGLHCIQFSLPELMGKAVSYATGIKYDLANIGADYFLGIEACPFSRIAYRGSVLIGPYRPFFHFDCGTPQKESPDRRFFLVGQYFVL